jgi:N-acetylglucosaminyl-diphospho-decaprenol L-rhamnosyltransferase
MNCDLRTPECYTAKGSPRLDIIVVNWNSGKQLRKCLESVQSARRDECQLDRVVVTDNASEDDSAEDLEHFGFQLVVIRNKANRGFAAACNQGARGSNADYLLFLNPDTRLCEDSLARPVAFMEHPENRRIGIVGIQLISENGQVSHTCTRFPKARHFASQMMGLDRVFPRQFPSHFMATWNHAESRRVDHVMGAFYLIRRTLFEKLDGFDERFFVYLEDLDLSYRAKRAGWGSFFLNDVKAYHKGGGTSEQIMPRRVFYALRSRILYGYKHFDRWVATALMLGTIMAEPLIRIGFGVSTGSAAKIKETLEAFGLLWRSLPEWISGREAA